MGSNALAPRPSVSANWSSPILMDLMVRPSSVTCTATGPAKPCAEADHTVPSLTTSPSATGASVAAGASVASGASVVSGASVASGTSAAADASVASGAPVSAAS